MRKLIDSLFLFLLLFFLFPGRDEVPGSFFARSRWADGRRRLSPPSISEKAERVAGSLLLLFRCPERPIPPGAGRIRLADNGLFLPLKASGSPLFLSFLSPFLSGRVNLSHGFFLSAEDAQRRPRHFLKNTARPSVSSSLCFSAYTENERFFAADYGERAFPFFRRTKPFSFFFPFFFFEDSV